MRTRAPVIACDSESSAVLGFFAYSSPALGLWLAAGKRPCRGGFWAANVNLRAGTRRQTAATRMAGGGPPSRLGSRPPSACPIGSCCHNWDRPTSIRPSRIMRVLGIESSCDETAVAIVSDGRALIADLVLSQLKEHRPFGGVVPEIAARSHLTQLDRLIGQALDQ